MQFRKDREKIRIDRNKEGKTMKTLFFVSVVMVAVFAATPVPALEPVELYDNFEAKVINPAYWTGNDSAATGMDILESARLLKVEPVYGFKGLNILQRSYAATGSNAGRSSSFNRVLFVDGTTIRTIQAAVVVKKIQATECSANPDATEPRVRIGGMFFNTGTTTPGDATNDIFAYIAIGRPTNSPNPADVLTIYGVVNQCTTSNCNAFDTIGTIEVGTVKVNQKVKVAISWEPGINPRFVFMKGKALKAIPYAGAVGGVPGSPSGGNKRLEVNNLIPDCTDISRPLAYMEAFFDDVKINAAP
jgi:hypothetical protein